MLNRITKYIDNNRLITSKSRAIIVGVSGGADSILLLELLHLSGYNCIAAHCNFNLRDNESKRDESFVIDHCLNRSIQLEKISFDTYKFAKENKLSIEMAARELRYNYFEELKNKYNAQAIAVAHHADDQAETLLLNLIRGSGLHGLGAMRPKNGDIIRPILSFTRDEVEEYCKQLNLKFIIDSSNNETIYRRNFIRHEIIPKLNSINNAASNNIARTAQLIQEAEAIYCERIEEIKSDIWQKIGEEYLVDIEKLINYPSTTTVLYELFSPYGFSRLDCISIFEALNAISGKQFISKTHRIVKDRRSLILSQIRDEDNDVQIWIETHQAYIDSPIRINIENYKAEDNRELSREKTVALLDADKIQFPLLLRRWKQGDHFIPLGMEGKKKLSDFFKDSKFTLSQKEQTWVLCSNNKIIWIVGHRIDNRFKVTKESKSILKLSID
ncbi:MAG: tRNA lysidine(34) synthetase TilS [Bacteroidales bacterium]